MRCKNCGSENDDNLYICQNCGSPLYDEEEQTGAADDATMVFGAAQGVAQNGTPSGGNSTPPADDEAEKKKKQQITIIVILSLILVAIIAGTAIAVARSNKADDNTLTTVSGISELSSETTTEEKKTTEQATEDTTEETTSEKTTETTTEETKYFKVAINVNDDGGSVSGDGQYALGDTATVVAYPIDGYSFDGWYQNNKKVYSGEKYTFTVTADVTLKAIFTIDNDEADGVDTIEGETFD